MGKISCIISLLAIVLFSACSTTKNTVNNDPEGTSFQTAIVVSSVSEEYAYVRNECDRCQFVRQSLVFKKKKPYDILEFKESDGTEVKYYFDISKFYGKGF